MMFKLYCLLSLTTFLITGATASVTYENSLKTGWFPIPWIPVTPSPTAAPTTTTTMAPAPTPSQDAIDFMAAFGPTQNTNRQNHGAGVLTRNDYLTAQAQLCAEAYATENPTPPANPTPCGTAGEIHDYADLVANQVPADWATIVTGAWYDQEKALMTWPAGPNDATVHFTQMVWKSSTEYGCAVVKNAAATRYFVSCVYSPPGNSGDYPGNVQQ